MQHLATKKKLGEISYLRDRNVVYKCRWIHALCSEPLSVWSRTREWSHHDDVQHHVQRQLGASHEMVQLKSQFYWWRHHLDNQWYNGHFTADGYSVCWFARLSDCLCYLLHSTVIASADLGY